MALLVGTSGWQYRDWRGRFYPQRLPQRAWLAHYAREFPTVEVNNAFYRLPERSVFARWRDETPPGFVTAVKVSRYLTHIRRLRDLENGSRAEQPDWAKLMASRRRKTLIVCQKCHEEIHRERPSRRKLTTQITGKPT